MQARHHACAIGALIPRPAGPRAESQAVSALKVCGLLGKLKQQSKRHLHIRASRLCRAPGWGRVE
jgi:hypothetical protein